MTLLIKQAHIIDPKNDIDDVRDVLIEGKIITKIAKKITVSADEEIEAKGLYLFPGLVDLHTHFREPGYEYKETIESGSCAARRGGFVGCVSMPNTEPACDNASIVETIVAKAKDAHFSVFPCGAITKNREGEELSEMADLKAAGCRTVSDDGNSVAHTLVFRRALEYAHMLGLLVMIHAEDTNLSKNGLIHEGLISTQLGLRGIPHAAEDIIVARDIELAKLTGARIHFQHVSTKRAIALIREAKHEGVAVTAEVTPHHLALIDEDIISYDTNFKVNPPFRSREDREALCKGLQEGVIDAIATDHAPHQEMEKDVEFDQAPFGTIGLETALAVILTQLYHTKRLSLKDIVQKMSVNPQAILGLTDFAEVKTGIEGNICLVDVNKEWMVEKNTLHSLSKNSCFLGAKLKGKVVATVCQGEIYRFD
ncbi:MAG: dihydroorotase [Candidatus Omnitrophica bacterium]|nr:dihydroorotase [Candidatus Omnitrophota bacterium]